MAHEANQEFLDAENAVSTSIKAGKISSANAPTIARIREKFHWRITFVEFTKRAR